MVSLSQFFMLCLCTVSIIKLRAEIPYDPFVDKAMNHKTICSQPFAVVGPCRAAHPRFSYDPSTKQCKSFTYGGCQGNENNFDTEGHCKRVCVNKQVCPIPGLMRPKEGCRYDESLNEMGCPKYKMVCDVKPGKCPADHQKARNVVLTECSHSDDVCPGSEKCCKIGRSKVCVPPIAS